VEEESTKEKGLGKTPEHPVSAAPEQENCFFNTASLKTKNQGQSLQERSREKEEKERGNTKAKWKTAIYFGPSFPQLSWRTRAAWSPPERMGGEWTRHVGAEQAYESAPQGRK